MEGHKTTITWSEGIEISKAVEKQNKIDKKDYQERTEQAYDELQVRLGSSSFRGFTELEDAASLYGVEPDDLIEMML